MRFHLPTGFARKTTMTTNDSQAEAMALARGWLSDLFAPWVQALHLTPVSVGPDAAVLRLPFDESLCRVGGTLCGQARPFLPSQPGRQPVRDAGAGK